MKGNSIGIEVKLTDRCVCECHHCMNRDAPDRSGDLDVPLFIERLGEFAADPASQRGAAAVHEVRITGGEPLLRPAEVLDIARACKALKIISGINTNGEGLSASVARQLKDAGLGRVKISLDGLSDEVLRALRGPGVGLERIVDAIGHARKVDIEVILRFTLCRPNAHQLVGCYQLARRMGVKTFQVKPIIRVGRASDFGGLLGRDEIARRLGELAREWSIGGPRVVALCWPSAHAEQLPVQVCGSLHKIYVDTDLATTICNYVPRPRKLGNLRNDTLHDLLVRRRRAALWQAPSGESLIAGCPQQRYFLSNDARHRT